MSFQGKYQILSSLGDGETQSFRAVQISSGRPVLVHHLAANHTPPAEPDLASLIFKLLVSSSAAKSQYLLDMGEDEGRIFVVTPDVPACLNLRQWLLSVAETPSATGAGAPPVQGTGAAPDAGNIGETRTYTTEALRQVSGSQPKKSASPPSQPAAPSLAAKTPEQKSAPFAFPPERPLPASFKAIDNGPTDFAGIWEKSPIASFAGQPAALPVASTPPIGASGAPELTAEFFSKRPPLGVQEAPTTAGTPLQALAAARQRPSAPGGGLLEDNDNAKGVADVVLSAPEAMKLSSTGGVGEVSIASAPSPAAAAPDISMTRVPQLIKELLGDSREILPKPSPPVLSLTQEPGPAKVKPAEDIDQPQIPTGFELVFQSPKPRSRLTLSGQSGIMSAPVLPVSPSGPVAPPARPLAAPDVLSTVVIPPAQKIAGSSAPESLKASGLFGRISPASQETSAPLASPPPLPRMGPESERPTRLASAPPAAPTRLSPTVPASPAALPPVAAPRAAVPLTKSPSLGPPGQYTRMIENIKAAAGPLPPAKPPSSSLPGARPPAHPAAPPTAPLQSSYLRIPTPQPPPYQHSHPQVSGYVSRDVPQRTASKKRNVWAPVLILASLFLMTVGLLLFFGLKH